MWAPIRLKGKTHYPKALKELAVIRILNGKMVDGYYASDGKRMRLHQNSVHPLKHARQEFLDRHRDFFRWKHFALEGSAAVRPHSLGNNHGLMCFGQAKFNEVLTHGMVEEGHVVGGMTQGALLLTAQPAGEGQTVEGARTTAVNQPDNDGIVEVEGKSFEVEHVSETPKKSKGEEKTSNAMMFCAIGIGALVLYNTM